VRDIHRGSIVGHQVGILFYTFGIHKTLNFATPEKATKPTIKKSERKLFYGWFCSPLFRSNPTYYDFGHSITFSA